jgi:DNA polymerase V
MSFYVPLSKRTHHAAKKDLTTGGVVLLLDETAQDAALTRLTLTDLWGIAGRLAAKLSLLGILTPLDLKRADPLFLRERLGVVTVRMAMELRGVACLDLERTSPDRKSIMASRSFGRAVSSLPEMEEAVASYTARAAEKLRRQKLATAYLTVFIETNRFKPGEAQHYAARPVRLAVATSDSGKLITAALAGLHAVWRDGYRYKKAGVVLLDLHLASGVQEGLFDKADDARRKALMRTLDGLNERYGRDTVSFAASGRRRPWKMQRDQLSPSYTTAWGDLLRV